MQSTSHSKFNVLFILQLLVQSDSQQKYLWKIKASDLDILTNVKTLVSSIREIDATITVKGLKVALLWNNNNRSE